MLCFTAGTQIAPGIVLGDRGLPKNCVRGLIKDNRWRDQHTAIRILKATVVDVDSLIVEPDNYPEDDRLLICFNLDFITVEEKSSQPVKLIKDRFLILEPQSTVKIEASIETDRLGWCTISKTTTFTIKHHGKHITYEGQDVCQRIDIDIREDGTFQYRISEVSRSFIK